ncbi:MAG: ribosome maturation factor RimP [Corynebacteriales bacterium]|nr:ribosome maturation factor RimP [Mycobacteriales bacterium]
MGQTPAHLKARIREVAEPVVVAAGYDIEDFTVSQAGRRAVVRIVVDRDGGVTLDEVAELSSQVSAALDASDGDADLVGPEPYTLEVSSPGVDRPLTQLRHWRRNIDRLVATSVEGKPVTGRILAVDGEQVTLDIDGVQRQFDSSALSAGVVQVEFNRKEG